MNTDKNKGSIRFSFHKEERLCSKKQFDQLFAEGNSFLVYPLKILLIETLPEGKFPVKAAFAVSKKSFKKAVIRNRIKRKMRESYRLHKHLLYCEIKNLHLAIAIIYIAKDDLPYLQIEKAIKKGISIIPSKLKSADSKKL